MKTKITLLTLAGLFATAVPSHAQFFNRLVDKAKDSAKSAIERNVEQKVEEGIDKVFDKDTYQKNDNSQEEAEPAQQQTETGWTCPACGTTGNTGKFCNECGAKKPENDGSWTCPACGTKGNTGKFCNECGAKKPGAEGAQAAVQKKMVVSEYVKCDFVPGDEVFFDDPVEGEQLGEFPSKWDLRNGNAEVAKLNGEQVISITEGGTEITPLMKTNSYLGDVYTLEFDFWGTEFTEDECSDVDAKYFLDFDNGMAVRLFLDCHGGSYMIDWHNASNGDWGRKDGELKNLKLGEWNHLAVSFNKRALKVYINGERMVNVPNAAKAESFKIANDLWKSRCYIKNIRLAKGAVPLYDRLMSDGKIITYAITFETGKADLKPESMVEIMRIAKLMQENPNLSFEVQGHCDATGSDKVNDPLSQKRAEAIVAALVEQGIASARLSAVGKGSHSPIASNSTDEGRAKNRRVEFVKK